MPNVCLEEAPNLNYLWAGILIEELYRTGVNHVCISPGSRSTPLALSAWQHSALQITTCYDERSMAFAALGIAKARKEPVALIVTSGSAVANLYPALLEAYTDEIPLIVITADRPFELLHNGANQSMYQTDFFGRYVLENMDLPCPTNNIKARAVLTAVDDIVRIANGNKKGPVHLNCHFREPLTPTPQAFAADCLTGLQQWASSRLPFTQYGVSGDIIQTLLSCSERGLLLLGALETQEESQAAHRIAEKLKWPVVSDVVSGVHDGHFVKFPNIEQWISNYVQREECIPDCILHIGGRLVTDKLAVLLNQRAGQPYIQISAKHSRMDPHHVVTHRLQMSIEIFESYVPASSSALQSHGFNLTPDVLQDGLTESLVARLLSENLPLSHELMIASSMPIRDMNWWRHFRQPCRLVRANRGLSGIDGVISTACGIGIGAKNPVTLVSGDLSFLHDTNGLSLIAAMQTPIFIVVLNNQGGKIFHHLPIAKYFDNMPPVMDTPHAIELKSLAQAHRLRYAHVSTPEAVVPTYCHAIASGQSYVIEIQTDVKRNQAFYARIEKEVKHHEAH